MQTCALSGWFSLFSTALPKQPTSLLTISVLWLLYTPFLNKYFFNLSKKYWLKFVKLDHCGLRSMRHCYYAGWIFQALPIITAGAVLYAFYSLAKMSAQDLTEGGFKSEDTGKYSKSLSCDTQSLDNLLDNNFKWIKSARQSERLYSFTLSLLFILFCLPYYNWQK